MKVLEENLTATRRGFLKMMGAMGAVGAVTGCGGGGDDDVIVAGGGGLEGAVNPEDLSDLSKADIAYITCPHNCGPDVRCVSKAWVVNGRIVRITTDDTDTDIDGNPRDKNEWNDPRQISCAKGHSYRYRVYHTGRIKYPMKQTKKRGDVTGFVRMSWQQAYKEVITKHRKIYAKYGPAAIHHGSNNASSGRHANAGNAVAPIISLGGTRGSFSNHSFHQYIYSYNMAGVPASGNWNVNLTSSQLPAITGGAIKNWVSFGANAMTTNNTLSYPYLRAYQLAKENNPNFKHYVISPELTDTGVVTATDWVQVRNYTDAALIAAMIYEMLVHTFKADGSIEDEPWLDPDYLDTCLYGFFDSPEYWINITGAGGGINGEITLSDQSADPTNWRKVNAVPSGMSYASWVMGSDNRLALANYSASTNYTAQSYGPMSRAGLCSLSVNGTPAHSADMNNTKYHTKKNYMQPKTPEWAEKICGTPAAVIRELAALYCDPANHPIFTEWTGGLQKSDNGVVTLFAIQTLFAVTKTWGYTHGSTGGMYVGWGGLQAYLGTAPSIDQLPNLPGTTNPTITDSGSNNPTTPAMSCKEHFNGLYFAFKDELDAKGFKGYANPFWDGSTRYIYDDAGAKTQVLYKRSGDAADYVPYPDPADGKTYNDFVGRDPNPNPDERNHDPVYVGKRMYIGCSGTQFNQIANPNWAAEIFELLPLASADPEDPDTFCMVVCEPYMSPQARFADYVLPLANAAEVVDDTAVGGVPFKRLPLSTPPGEAKDSWEAAFIGWNEQSKLGAFTASRIDEANPYNRTIPANAGYAYIGSTYPNYMSVTDQYRKKIQSVCNGNAEIPTPANSRFSGMTVEQAIASQIVPKTPTTPPAISATTFTAARDSLNTYLAGSMNAPFITFTSTVPIRSAFFNPSVENAMAEFTAITAAGMPGHHGRMTCYAEYAVYTWAHAYDIHHGWLPADKRGQTNKDYENDPKLHSIPLYYHFEDVFNEAYGVFNPRGTDFTQGGWKLIGPKPATNDISLITDKLTLTVGSTHDRYRSHSSQAENPYLRELNHRKKGGGFASGNDWNEYCVVPEVHPLNGLAGFNPMLSTAIQKNKMETASWHEFWMNNEDAAQFGIRDGALIRVSNPVGAIRVIARVTKRIMRGHGQIHQGAWYDPNPLDGVDDGACANTLMSNRGSKFDNGNSVHSAYCVVELETAY
jgi:anaerobic selenocysteine-containing dehydrogenase